jgi:hypothetical protein
METQRTHFKTGRTLITSQALGELEPMDVLVALRRHSSKDWGECCQEDAEANDQAVADGSRILSVYRDRHGTQFWIITEADRSATTVLLPSDY